MTITSSSFRIHLSFGEYVGMSVDKIEKIGSAKKGDYYKAWNNDGSKICLTLDGIEESGNCESYYYGYYSGENSCYPDDKECGYLIGVRRHIIKEAVNSDNLEDMNRVLVSLHGEDVGDDEIMELFDKIVLGVEVNMK